VESLTMFAFSFDDHVDVWVLLVGVELCGATHNCTYVELSFMWSE
jgi:hypothetical protein